VNAAGNSATPAAGSFARGVFWMVLTAISFSVLAVAVRGLSDRFPAVEIVLVRALVGLFLIVPLIGKFGLGALRTRRLPMHMLRTGFAFIAMLGFFYALANISVADATAFSFLIPLFTTVAAALVLGETVDAPRWLATAIGFLGALVIIRPGFQDISFPAMIAIASAVFYAGAWTSVKILTRTESAAIIVFYMNLFMTPVALAVSLFFWVVPTWDDAPLLLVMALAGWSAHFCQARSFAAADASAVVPFDFLRLPFGALFAWIIFSQPSDIWTWAGAAIIFASGWYISWRETRAA
jgi:drug/metabolite transporter (DMT)-like permease